MEGRTVARKNPIGKIKDTAVETIKDPIGTARSVAGQAAGQALVTIGTVSETVKSAVGRRRATAPSAPSKPVAVPDGPRKIEGDPLAPAMTAVSEPKPASKAPSKKAPAKKAPAKKTSAKKPAAKTTTKKATAKKAAKKTPAKKATKATGAKATTKKTAAKKAPLSAAELAAGAGTEVITPVGTRGADVATNPDTAETDLQQPGTEPLMDPATTSSVASETDVLRRAADPDKG